MADEKLEIIIQAVDQVSGKLQDIENAINKTSETGIKQFAKMGAAVLVAKKAFEAISGFVGDSIKEYSKQEDSINRLNYALKNQGTYTKELSKKYQDMASSFQSSTRFADDAIEQLQQQLISVGNVAPEQMGRVVKATLDFATATGTNLATAQDIMAKSAAGNTEMLKRYGIILDDNIPKSAKFAAALSFIEKRFGGSAQEDINTFSGQMEKLKNKWGDFLESIGKFIVSLGAINSGITMITNAIEFYGKVVDGINDKQKTFSSEQTKFMTGQVDAINQQIIQLERYSKVYGDQEGAHQRINDLLIQRNRIEAAIKAMDTKSDADNAARNSMIQSQQESEITKNKLKSDADEIAAAFKAELDALNQIELAFKAGQISADDYYNKISAHQTDEEFRRSHEISLIQEKAELERMVNDKALMDFMRVEQEKVRVLQETKNRMLMSNQQIVQSYISAFSQIQSSLQGAASANKAFAVASQVVSIAMAIMNTARGVTEELKKGIAGIPTAAIIAAAGAVQISTIASQKFAKGSDNVRLLSSGTDTVPSLLTPGEMVFPRTMSDAIRSGKISVSGPGGGGGGGDVNIYMSGVTITSKDSVRELAEELGFEIERRSRNARSNI